MNFSSETISPSVHVYGIYNLLLLRSGEWVMSKKKMFHLEKMLVRTDDP